MGMLDRQTRSQLLAVLNSMSVLDTSAGRNLLLADLPPALVRTLERNDSQAIDLANIVHDCDAWSAAALRTLIENARNLMPDSDAVIHLQTILTSLDTLPAAPNPPPAILPPSGTGDPPKQPTAPALPVTRHILRATLWAFLIALLAQYLGSILVTNYKDGLVWSHHELKGPVEDWPFWVLSISIALAATGGFIAVLWFTNEIEARNPTGLPPAIWFLLLVAGAFIGVALYRLFALPWDWNTPTQPAGVPSPLLLMPLSSALVACGIWAMFDTGKRIHWRGRPPP